MSIDSETLKEKKDKTKRQEEKLKNLKKFEQEGIPDSDYSDFIRKKKKEKKDDMSMPPDRRTDEQKKQDAIDALLKNLKLTPKMLKGVADSIRPMKKGGEVKGYHKGGSVHKKKNTMATTKGWGISRKT